MDRLAQNRVHQLECWGMLFWLLKDLGWVLLVPALSCTGAISATMLELYVNSEFWPTWTSSQKVHSVAVFLWLFGNVVWLISELLFDESFEAGRRFFWYHGPLVGVDHSRFREGVYVARSLFVLAMLLLSMFYLQSATQSETGDRRRRSRTGSDAALVVVQQSTFSWQTYSVLFIGPWIMKDLLWTMDVYKPSTFFAALVVILLSSCLAHSRDAMTLTSLLWALGNTIWMVGEVHLHDSTGYPRLIAASILVCAGVVAARRLMEQKVEALEIARGMGPSSECGSVWRPCSQASSAAGLLPGYGTVHSCATKSEKLADHSGQEKC